MNFLSQRVAARFKKKREVPKANGKGTTTVYEYSDRQIARRNNEKASRLEKLRGKMSGLRKQVKKDLKSEDPDTALTALAVALIDHTYERVGNPGSAKGDSTEDGEKHFGVTGWQKSHISFGKGKASISYVGKSGVRQKKQVTDAAVLTALRNAYEGCEGDDIFCHGSGKVDASKVNAYLKKFGITAKDLRGYHANDQMKSALKAVRGKGGALSEEPEKRKAQLKKEFEKALKETAEAVGHEAATLKSQYLVPGLEAAFLKDGTIMQSMKKASQILVARYKQALAHTFDAAGVEKWRKELRVMTKIYKSIGLEGDAKDLEAWDEARRLFSKFRENFETWVYKGVLPKIDKKDEHIIHADIKKEAWNAIYTLSDLFPTSWDSKTDSHGPAPWVLKSKRDPNIKRYQKAFSKAFDLIEGFLASPSYPVKRHSDEKYNIAGMNVLVKGHGRDEESQDDIDVFLRKLQGYVAPVIRAGFRDAVKGLQIIVSYDNSPSEFLTAGRYNTADDSMTMLPVGLAGNSGGTVVHELGHRYWFREMTSQARAHWNEVMSNRGTKITQKDADDFFKLMQKQNYEFSPDASDLAQLINRLDLDEETLAKYRELSKPFVNIRDWDAYKKHLALYVGNSIIFDDISEYANDGDPVEIFAEVFRLYVLEGPGRIGPLVLDLFKRVVATGGVKLAFGADMTARVASRYQALRML